MVKEREKINKWWHKKIAYKKPTKSGSVELGK